MRKFKQYAIIISYNLLDILERLAERLDTIARIVEQIREQLIVLSYLVCAITLILLAMYLDSVYEIPGSLD